ncbi:substrate-binding domain-containing protein [Halomarina ordinaria]|uniref:TAXI family TRAP transporter solute-binding subunit n=1 Tax=Halomarina ordinaria TaxID=3033939 RepID=A0ABD5U5Y5_9EURY|nr:substrate-binding domain-containing protein [Halomarina sp. PSRA2]
MVASRERSSRRTFLKTTLGAGGALTLAGCLEGDGGSGGGNSTQNGSGGSGASGDLVMLTSTETTSAYAMSQGISAVVSENADEVSVDARPSEGTNANIGALDRNEADIVYIQNWTANKVMEGEDPFGDISFTPNQVHHLYDLGWFLCTPNEGWETVADIESGSRVSPTPRGSGTAEMLEQALSYVTEDYERVSTDYGSQGSAMNEGRLDVGAGTFVNFSVEPSWLQEMKSTTDLRVLDFPDEVIGELEDDPAIVISEIETGELDGYAYLPEPLRTPALSYNFVVRNDADYDTIYTYLETVYGNREALQERNQLMAPLAEGEQFLANPYEMPFHPAAADFYEEQGVWSDEYERGDE